MMMRRILAAAVLGAVLAAPGRAIELTLAENRGESGSIGFVDVERIFRAHPATLKVKDELEKEISKREELLTSRRQELYALRAELEKLRRDREFLRKRADSEETQAAALAAAQERERIAREANEAALAAVCPVVISTAGAAVSTAAAGIVGQTERDLSEAATLVDYDTIISSAAQKDQARPDLPPQGNQQVSPAGGPLQPQPGQNLPPVAGSTGTAEGLMCSTETIVLAPVVISSTQTVKIQVPRSPSRGELEALEEKIAASEVQILNKESTVEEFRQRAEKELLEYEQKRMQLILGGIYMVLREVAINEGVSVVVDKKSILYGQNAVDLTDKLLNKLAGK